MMKLEGNEMYEVYGPNASEIEERKTKSEARRQQALEAAQALVISKIATIKPVYVSEEGREPSNMVCLQMALSLASADELEAFCKNRTIPFEDGYIKI